MRVVTEIVRNCGKSFGFMTRINLNLGNLYISKLPSPGMSERSGLLTRIWNPRDYSTAKFSLRICFATVVTCRELMQSKNFSLVTAFQEPIHMVKGFSF